MKNDRIGHAESELTKKSNSDSLCCQESDSDSTQKPPTPDDPESATLLSGAQEPTKTKLQAHPKMDNTKREAGWLEGRVFNYKT